MTTTYHGQCFCGETSFTCIGEPLFTQYCHCNKCREIAGLSNSEKDKVGYSFTAAYLTENFNITSQQKAPDQIIKNNAKLLLCSNCKSLIYGISLESEKQAGIGINANNFIFTRDIIPKSFKPVRHIWYENHIVDFDDDLPKFMDAPKEQFGSGKLFTGHTHRS